MKLLDRYSTRSKRLRDTPSAAFSNKPGLIFLLRHGQIQGHETRRFIGQTDIPVVGLSFYKAGYEKASVLNPKLKDPSNSYTEGTKEAVRVMGDILDRKEKAEALLSHIFKNREMIQTRLGNLKKEERIPVYMAYPKLFSMGTGKYASVIMERAGGLNVAMELSGYKQVSM